MTSELVKPSPTPEDTLVDWLTVGDAPVADYVDETTAPSAPRNRHHRRMFRRSDVRDWLRRAVDDRAVRITRLRLLGWTVVGVACLWIAHALAPRTPSLMVLPASPAHWAAVVCGLAGMWLVPGMWMSALLIRTGANLAAWWATRLAGTLVWYALVGPAIHYLGRGAWVTTIGILLATTVSSLAVAAGLSLGTLGYPRVRWQRLITAALVGGAGVQVAVTLAMRWWSGDMNYTHIRRLDWLIVAAAVALSLLGALSRPVLPAIVRSRHARSLVPLVAVAIATVIAVVLVNSRWSPAQQMPSAIGMQQIPVPAGSDAAFDLTAIGPDGPRLIGGARFSVTSSEGVPVPVTTRVSELTGGHATLLVTIRPVDRAVVCRSAVPGRLIVRDAETQVHMQAVLGTGRCAS